MRGLREVGDVFSALFPELGVCDRIWSTVPDPLPGHSTKRQAHVLKVVYGFEDSVSSRLR
jgi:hypothetical protein